MNINANIETAGTVREKVKSALGFDCASALDLVRREDFANEEAYLDAAAKAELERSSPEYRAARSRLKNEYRARQEEKQRTAQSEAYKTIRENTSLDELARRDLAANRIAASELGKTIERYAAELGEKRKSEKAANTMFNAILCGTL